MSFDASKCGFSLRSNRSGVRAPVGPPLRTVENGTSSNLRSAYFNMFRELVCCPCNSPEGNQTPELSKIKRSARLSATHFPSSLCQRPPISFTFSLSRKAELPGYGGPAARYCVTDSIGRPGAPRGDADAFFPTTHRSLTASNATPPPRRHPAPPDADALTPGCSLLRARQREAWRHQGRTLLL